MLAFLGLILLFVSTVIIPGVNCSNLQRRDSDEPEPKTSGDNDYLDDIITKTIDENRHKLEPYRIDNATFYFEQKVMLVTFKREISLNDLVITGIPTIHREGDCVRTNKDGISKLSADLGMGVLEFESKATAKFMKIGPKFKISGEMGYLMMHLEVIRDNNAGTPPKVKKLEIYDQKGFDIKVSETGIILSKVIELITKAAKKLFKGKINKSLEEKIKEFLDTKFEDSVFPIDELF